MKKFFSIILKISIAVIVFISIGLLFNKVFYHPITPAVPQDAYDMLSAGGYKTVYATEKASDDLKNMGLTDCIAAEKENIRIYFYFFDNDEAAQTVYNKSVSLIHTERRDPPTRDYSEGDSNHWRYTLKGQTMYSTAIHVGSTAIYAYGNIDDEAEINRFLKSIGYIENK